MKKLTPCRKRRFGSKLDAKMVLARLQARDHGERRVYWCYRCHAYHLTSQWENRGSG